MICRYYEVGLAASTAARESGDARERLEATTSLDEVLDLQVSFQSQFVEPVIISTMSHRANSTLCYF